MKNTEREIPTTEDFRVRLSGDESERNMPSAKNWLSLVSLNSYEIRAKLVRQGMDELSAARQACEFSVAALRELQEVFGKETLSNLIKSDNDQSRKMESLVLPWNMVSLNEINS